MEKKERKKEKKGEKRNLLVEILGKNGNDIIRVSRWTFEGIINYWYNFRQDFKILSEAILSKFQDGNQIK